MVDAQSAAGSGEAAIEALQEIGGEAAALAAAAAAVPYAIGGLGGAVLQIVVGAQRIGAQQNGAIVVVTCRRHISRSPPTPPLLN